MKLKVKKLHEEALLPKYGTPGAACFDLFACLPDGDAAIASGYGPSVAIPTGLAFEIPEDWVMLLFSRSGHGFKQDTRLANCVGVIDSDYRGEVMVKLTREHKGEPSSLFFTHGASIAQAMLVPVERIEFDEVPEDEDLSETERGTNGFGHTDGHSA